MHHSSFLSWRLKWYGKSIIFCLSNRLLGKIITAFDGKKYYYTTLGNYLNLKEESIDYLINLIESKTIDSITLYYQWNELINDIVNNNDYFTTNGMQDLVYDISIKKEYYSKFLIIILLQLLIQF